MSSDKLSKGTRIGKSTKMHGDTQKAMPKNKGRSSTGRGINVPKFK